MSIWEAVILGIIEGLTEFLPISSTAHLTITEKILGYSIDDPDVTAFTAIIQLGAIVATILFFRRDLWRILKAWVRGVVAASGRADRDYRFGWAILLGSIPIGVVGLIFRGPIQTTLRNLWVTGTALIVWSGVMWLADRKADQSRHEKGVGWRDTLIMGTVQSLALIPGVSRSGAALSAGLLRGLDRVTVTRLTFFLSIPALTAAGAFQVATQYDNIASGVGWPATLTATAASFVMAYLVVAWLLRFIARHTFSLFIVYRVILGSAVLGLVATGILAAT